MDTLAFVQQLLSCQQSQQQQQQQQQQQPPPGFVRISPTTTAVDAATGLPTASVAEPGSLGGLDGYLLSSLTAEAAALPPETASTSGLPFVANYVAAMQAALWPPPQPQASPAGSSSSSVSAASTTSSESFVTLALGSLVSPGDFAGLEATIGGSGQPGGNPDSKSSTSSDAPSTKGTLLCQVCSDTASGFHYGVFACEGCKGFFRRSIQQKISYRPCTKSQQCAIVRNNRNRCQYCRLKKCISVGMSRDAVRFGRVPKREKVKMVEEMQRATVRSLLDSMTVELEDESAFVAAIDAGFIDLGSTMLSEIHARGIAPHCGPSVGDQMQHLFSALAAGNGMPTDLPGQCPIRSQTQLPLIRAVVTFSESIRGFHLLFQKDRIRLLKSSLFQVLLVRLATLRGDTGDLAFSATPPQRLGLPADAMGSKSAAEAVCDFVQRFRTLSLNTRQLALFAGLVLCQADVSSNSAATFDVSQMHLVKMLHDKLWLALQRSFVGANAIEVTMILQSLFSAFGDLKRLNEIHDARLRTTPYTGHHLAMVQPQPPPTPTPLPMQAVVIKKENTPVVNLDAMPALRKALEATPSTASGKTATTDDGNRLSITDRHPAMTSLLSRPPTVVARPQATNAGEGGEEDDQPLNLCVRDAAFATNNNQNPCRREEETTSMMTASEFGQTQKYREQSPPPALLPAQTELPRSEC